MQVTNTNPYGYPTPAYGAGAPAPVTYSPYQQYSSPDMYNPNGTNPYQAQQPKKEYVTKQSVTMGLAGAGIGFLIGGPMGALIGGVGALLLSILMNIFTSSKQTQPQVPQQQGMVAPQQYQYPTNYYPNAVPQQQVQYPQMTNPYGK